MDEERKFEVVEGFGPSTQSRKRIRSSVKVQDPGINEYIFFTE